MRPSWSRGPTSGSSELTNTRVISAPTSATASSTRTGSGSAMPGSAYHSPAAPTT